MGMMVVSHLKVGLFPFCFTDDKACELFLMRPFRSYHL